MTNSRDLPPNWPAEEVKTVAHALNTKTLGWKTRRTAGVHSPYGRDSLSPSPTTSPMLPPWGRSGSSSLTSER